MLLIIIFSTLLFLLGVLRWSSTVINFITFIPFYYAPFIFISNLHSDEWLYLRSGKDFFIISILLAWIVHIFRTKSIKYIRSYLSLLVLSFILIGFIKLLQLDDLWLPVSRAFITYSVWFYLASDVIYNEKNKRRILSRLIIVSFFVSFIGLIEFILGGAGNIYSQAAGSHRIISTLFSPNALGWYLTVINALILSVIKYRYRLTNIFITSKKWLIFIWLLNTTCIILSGSRGSFLVNLSILILATIDLNKITLEKILYSLVVITLLIITTIYAFIASNLRVFSGLETSRWDLYLKYLNNLPFDFTNLIIGFRYELINQYYNLGLLDDSFILLIIAFGGILSLVIFLCIVMHVFFTDKKNYMMNSNRLLLFPLMAMLVLSITSNFLLIFPHSLIFWLFLGMINHK